MNGNRWHNRTGAAGTRRGGWNWAATLLLCWTFAALMLARDGAPAADAPAANDPGAASPAAKDSAASAAGAPASAAPVESSEAWAFAALADNRAFDERPKDAYESVLNEIRDRATNPAPAFGPCEFVVGCGDLRLTADNNRNWRLWRETFADSPNKPGYYPVIGNWDDGDLDFMRTVVLPAQKGVHGSDPNKYYVDWRNVRLIVSGEAGYVAEAIRSAPPAIRHIFVADHYPVFPRNSHLQKPSPAQVELWKTLVKNRDRVRAYLCGHTHHYSRMRVADPSGKVLDDKTLVDEEGGVYQIDCGNAGRASHGEEATTIVQIRIDGGQVNFRTLQAPNAQPSRFRVVDLWTIPALTGK